MMKIVVSCPICLHHPTYWLPEGDRHYYTGCPEWKCGDFILTDDAKWASERITERTEASEAIRTVREEGLVTLQFNANFIKKFINETQYENAEPNE